MSENRIYEPSPAQIWAACRAIQNSWSERERRSRAHGTSDSRWYPPGVWQMVRIGLNDRPQLVDN